MTRFGKTAFAIATVLALGLFTPVAVYAGPIRYWGANAELSISEVSDRTVRIVLSPLDDKGVPRPAPASTALVDFQPKLKMTLRELNAPEDVAVGKLRLKIKLDPLTFTVTDASGKVVQELALTDADGSMTFRTAGPVLGLGEGADQFDRSGHLYPMLNGQRAPFLKTHGATIPVPFLIGTEGWAMFVNGPWGQFDLRDGKGKFVPNNNAKGMQQLVKEPLQVFVMALDQPADALVEYIRLSGKPIMPPKWVMGYMQSHRTLAGPHEPLDIVKTFRDKKLPLDAVIYLGTGYCPNGWNMGHGTLDFNPKAFDDPPRNIKALHDEHVKIVLHVNKAPAKMFGASISEKSENPIHISNYWKWHSKVFAMGIDAWWPDDGDELPIEARLARHRCYYEGPLLDRPNERPWSLHRNGYAGAQRYGGWIWTGDPNSQWATLAAHVPVGVNYSLSLTPFWGSDIGGFVATKELTGELYTRWFQFGAFNPLFRAHGRNWKLRLPFGWNTGEVGPIEGGAVPDKSELHNAEVEPICKKYLELRYRLLPYNYTLMRESCDTGMPAIRALWLHFSNDPEAVKLGNEFLWGRDLLVAPVVEKGQKTRHLYLPEGTWYDWWTWAKLDGKRWIDRPVDLATMPIYVRGGAIIPLDPVRQFTSQPVTEPTTIQVFRGADGSFTLYDDDGKSLDYLAGKSTWTKFTWNESQGKLTIENDARSVGAPVERVFDVLVLPDKNHNRVNYDGKKLEVKF